MRSLLYLTLLVFLPVAVVGGSELQIMVLDVGEGQAVLLKRENKSVLIDTGHAGMARSVLDKLAYYGVSQLDRIILTHLHPDHASGFYRIREAFPSATIYDNGDLSATHSNIDMVRWLATALIDEQSRKVLRAGDNIVWMGVKITTLWPSRLEGSDLNRNSLVFVIEYAASTAILMGDVSSDVELQLLDKGVIPRDVELLVAGHHGSKYTSHEKFLQRLRPKTCVVSVNAENIRGYPDSATLRRLNDYCQELLRTDITGDIVIAWHTHNKDPNQTKPYMVGDE